MFKPPFPFVLTCTFLALTTLAYAQTSIPPCLYVQNHALTVGSRGGVVSSLQKSLNAYGAHVPVTGYFGPLTRKELDLLCIVAPLPVAVLSTTPPATTTLAVTAPAQPVSAAIPSAASGVPFINVTFTAGDQDVTIHSITVELTGAASIDAIQSIALNDPSGLQVGDVQPSFSSNRIAILEQPFTIPANTSETFSIVGNMPGDLSGFTGETPALQVDSVSASVPVTGSFPIKGSAQTLVGTSLIGGATATVSQFDPAVSSNHYIYEKEVRFSGLRITANAQEDLTLSYLIWRQSGTASVDDLANVVTVVNGSSTPTMVKGHDYISLFSPGIVIPKGQSIDAYIQGDLNASGAGHTAEFDIYDNTDDVGLTGNTYGFGVGITPGGNTSTNGNSVFITSDGTLSGNTGTPFYKGSVATIHSGTFLYIGNAH
jgi:hypothetical protein